MKRIFALAVAIAAVCSLVMVAHAQSFKVKKFSIGGDGGTDYLTAEPGTGRVFVSRGSHVMVLDAIKGTVIGDIPETPSTHGIALAPASNHGFTTNRGDSTVTMFDLKTLAEFTFRGGLQMGKIAAISRSWRTRGRGPKPADF